MKTVLLDTNFLLIPGQFKVDIFSEIDRLIEGEYRIVVAEPSFEELEKILKEGDGEDKSAAKLGLALIKSKGVEILSQPQKVFKGVDDFLLETAVENNFIVGTADRELRKRLKHAGIPVIVLRSKQHLVLE
jgi:rRNA-processing protein FCF1